MDQLTEGVVLFNIDDYKVTLTARLDNAWIHVSAETCNFKQSAKLKKSYADLCHAANAQILQEQDSEDEEEQLDVQNTAESQSSCADKPPDSGYISAEDEEGDGQGSEKTALDAKVRLQQWLLEPTVDQFSRSFSGNANSKHRSLSISEWYLSDFHAYKIKASSGDVLIAEGHSDFDKEQFIKQNLVPQTSLPKYLCKLSGVSWYSPHDIKVCATSHDIHHPIHPTLVQIESSSSSPSSSSKAGSTCFFKLATDTSFRAVRRELRTLHRLQRRNLINGNSNGIRAPRLEGLVSSPCAAGSRIKICGFLLSPIPEPAKSLVELNISSVNQTTREHWARECERMIKILHRNNIVWGDAKADNFMVDKEDKIWMIDFGGSYTDGWIDPELMETEAGDKMANAKIVDAVTGPAEEEGEEPQSLELDASPADGSDRCNEEPKISKKRERKMYPQRRKRMKV